MPLYSFRCPVCNKLFRYDQPGEPLCTGPSETLDEHEPTIMHLKGIDGREVGPRYAAMRAEGELLMPESVNTQRELIVAQRR